MYWEILGVPIYLTSIKDRRSTIVLHGVCRSQSRSSWYGDQPGDIPLHQYQERSNPSFDVNQAIYGQCQCGDLMDFKTPIKSLLHFEGGLSNELQAGILFSFRDYLELVDWTGRIIRKDKRSHIDNALPPILHRLQISPRQWLLNTTQFEAIHPSRFNRVEPNLDTG